METIIQLLSIRHAIYKLYFKILFGESEVHYAHAFLTLLVFVALLSFAISYTSLFVVHLPTPGDTIRLRLKFWADVVKLWVTFVSTFLLALTIQDLFYLGSDNVYYRVHTREVEHFELYFKKQKKQVLGPQEVAFLAVSTLTVLLLLYVYVFKFVPFVANKFVRSIKNMFNWLKMKVRTGIEKATKCALTMFGLRKPFMGAVKVVEECDLRSGRSRQVRPRRVSVVVNRASSVWENPATRKISASKPGAKRASSASIQSPATRGISTQRKASVAVIGTPPVSKAIPVTYVITVNRASSAANTTPATWATPTPRKASASPTPRKKRGQSTPQRRKFEERSLLPNASSLSDVSSVSSYSVAS